MNPEIGWPWSGRTQDLGVRAPIFGAVLALAVVISGCTGNAASPATSIAASSPASSPAGSAVPLSTEAAIETEGPKVTPPGVRLAGPYVPDIAVRVVVDGLRMRAEPSTEADIVAGLDRNDV